MVSQASAAACADAFDGRHPHGGDEHDPGCEVGPGGRKSTTH